MRDGGAGRGHVFNPTILREYDIRGVVDETLSEADARAVGRAFAAVVAEKGGKRVAIGRDGRLSSPALEAALVEGLTGGGIDVVRIGLGPTPGTWMKCRSMPPTGAVYCGNAFSSAS